MELSNRSKSTWPSDKSPEDFSLILGGPLFQIFRRAYLTGGGLELLRRRILFLTAISWLPLLLLSALEGHAWGDSVRLSFLKDIDTHARFLVALPLLLLAELVVHQRMRNVVGQFAQRKLIPANAQPEFDDAVASLRRWRNSLLAELLILLFVYGIGVLLIWRKLVDVDLTSWHGPTHDGTLHPSIAGWWLGLISLPIFQFLLFRWYYRLLIWARFLWQVSRIKLSLLPTHPDRSGGIGFLANVSFAFIPLLLAQGVLLSGMMANRVLYTGARLTQFELDIGALVCSALLFILGPLLFFSPQLGRVKRTGRREYGTLAQHYVREFDHKWLRGGAPADEPFIGSGDIQSLADLGNSYQVIQEMRFVPFTTKTIAQLGIALIAPLLPLTLTMIPLNELLARLVKILF